MKKYKKNHVSKYGIGAMFEVIFYLFIYLFNKIKYKENYLRFKVVKKVMLNISKLQKQYVQKTLNFATGETDIDYSTVPTVYYQFDNNKIDLKVRFHYRIKESDINAFLEEIRFATQLKTIDFKAKDLYFFVSLVSDAGAPLAEFMSQKDYIPFGTQYGLPVFWNYNKYPHAIISVEISKIRGRENIINLLFVFFYPLKFLL